MSTIDVVEEKSFFQSIQTVDTSNTNTIAYDSQEMLWLAVFLMSCMYFVYTFLKRKP